jgi:hypothetical protein
MVDEGRAAMRETSKSKRNNTGTRRIEDSFDSAHAFAGFQKPRTVLIVRDWY